MTSIQPDCHTPALGSPNKVTSEGGVFVQDKWTMDRLTVSGGVRIDWFFSENPAFHLGPSMLTPNRNYDVPKFSTTRYKDWTPKFAAAYDLFGDGRTALKANVGKYVLGQALVVGGLASQAGYNVQLTSSRSWVDNDGDFVPDCDLTRNTQPGSDGGRRRQPGGHLRRRGRSRTRTSTATRSSPTSRCRTTHATAGASGRTAGSTR